MYSSMWVAKTGLDAQQTRMSVIANNLANVNTTGFKRDRAMFQDLLYQNFRAPGGQNTVANASPTGLMLGTGTQVVATGKIYAQGNMINTTNALDVAINGDGFFQVLQPDGTTAYTRDGTFQLSATGQLVTAQGSPVQPPVTIPPTAKNVTIGTDGVISATLVGQTASTPIGNIQLARFPNPAGLESMGQNLARATAASGAVQTLAPGANGAGTLMQGALEASNVNVVEEMVNMIETQRHYEINSKAINASDEMLKFINNNT